jgi:di/tricarboxylate transporter
MLVLAVAVTPFVNNASTALVLGPIAVAVAGSAGVDPRPLLLAVAIGASIDFLTPFGHHNNTLVMGLAGYRFRDFLKAGWPVTLVTVITALTLLLAMPWRTA